MNAQIHEGMEVLDRNGDKIGIAGETLGQYFNVDAGLLGMKEYYVPFDAVADVREKAIWLNISKDRLGSMGWEQAPSDYARAGAATPQTDTMRLREEQLQVTKTPVETGRVQLGKEVVEEEKRIDVPVTREEVYVERHPVDRRTSDRPIDATQTETIRVPVTEERVEVSKQAVVYEEVGVEKRVTQETEQVSDTVRREELRVNKQGDVDLSGGTETTR